MLSIDIRFHKFTSFYNREGTEIVADYVIIMGYEMSTQTELRVQVLLPLPVWRVEEGIQQTLKEVPKNKVVPNGVPFYTRLWFTDKAGTVTSEIMGMDQAKVK